MRSEFHVFLLFVVLIFFALGKERLSYAQGDYYLKTYTTENGLPHNHVLSIAQDQTGFLWIATWDGLSRFDGYEFKNYYHNPGDSSSIPFFIVNEVCVDGHNNVWILCEHNKVFRYDRASDRFVSFDNSICNQLITSEHYDIDRDVNGNLWIYTDRGILRVSYKTLRAEFIRLMDHHKDNRAMQPYAGFFIDELNYVWLNGPDCLTRFLVVDSLSDGLECHKNKVFTVSSDNGFRLNNREHINFYKAFYKNTSTVWLFSEYGIYQSDTTTGRLLFDPLGRLFCINISNIENFVDIEQKAICHYLSMPEAPWPHCFISDHENTIWISGTNKSGTGLGLTKIIPVTSKFQYMPDKPSGGKSFAVFSVLKDQKGNIWIGSRGIRNLICIKQDGSIKDYSNTKGKSQNGIGQVRAILEDSTGIWLGYSNGLLLYYTHATGNMDIRIDPSLLENENEFHFSIHCMSKGDQGRIIIAGSGIIYIFDPLHNTLCKKSDYIVPMECYFLEKDSCGSYWVGSGNSSLFYFDAELNFSRSYKICKKNYNLEDICFGINGDMWISTLGGGICRFDPISRGSEFFTTADGLSNNTTYGILSDQRGNLWISTNHGLSRFNPVTNKFRIFGPTDGLTIDEFNADAVFQTSDGEMLFGGMGGVVSFYPDTFEVNTPAGKRNPLVITGFWVSGEPRYFNKAVYDLHEICLFKGDDNFGICFACMNFNEADKIQYRYRLTGYEEDWIITGYQQRSVNYAGLSPGKFRMEIEATNPEGEWVNQTTLNIVIPPFFYQTTVFKIGAMLLIFMVTLLIFYLFSSQIRTKARQENDHWRLESLRGQMNPHFVFNSLNSINYFISNNDRLSANRYISDFAKLIRSVIGNLSVEYISLTQEMESLKDYLDLEHLRFGDKFDYTIKVAESIEQETMKVLPGLVQPFIENAIWHGVRGLENRKGFIMVEFLMNESGFLKCVVEDNGIGRKLAEERRSKLQKHKSRGVDIVSERLRIINGLNRMNYAVQFEDLYKDSEETGTKVIVDIPVKGELHKFK